MSDQQGYIKADNSRRIIFRGSGKGYFLVLIVNLMLIVVTFGIFTPWAIVRSKRYLYSNTELSGSSFSYNVTGGSIFISWLCVFIFVFATQAAIHSHSVFLAFFLIALMVIFLPYLIMLSLRYQMQSTTLNGVRFNFKSSGVQAWWAILGCPLLMLGVVFLIFNIMISVSIAITPFDFSRVMTTFALSIIVAVMACSVVQGVTVGLWLKLFFNNLSFGTQKFAAQVSIKKCVLICFNTMLILIPFLIVIMGLILPNFLQLISIGISGDIEQIVASDAMKSLQTNIILCYVIYLIGVIVCISFLSVKLRHYYFNTIVLSEKIAFRSTLTVVGFITQLIINLLITACTLGFGYPWARIRYCHYLAKNTWVDGDLDELVLQDHNEEIATDIVSRLSRGLVPNLSL
jgi:uncharacterized membrane protein YjgN (DUF898 family)